MIRQKLLIEEKTEELLAEVNSLLRGIRYPCKASKDLGRSADSVHLVTGEGIAVFSPKMKIAKYEIARGEAKEVQKALTALVIKGKLSEKQIEPAFDLADHIIGMLTNMIKRAEARL